MIELATAQESAPEVPLAITEMVHRLVMDRAESDEWKAINRFERWGAGFPQQHMPLNHVFAKGSYTRSIFMPAGTLLTSRIHMLENPFVVSMGVFAVWDNEHGWQVIRAIHIGVTTPGTRRILYIFEDTIMTTFHLNPDNETDPDKIVDRVTFSPMKLGHMDGLPENQLAAVCAGAMEGSP